MPNKRSAGPHFLRWQCLCKDVRRLVIGLTILKFSWVIVEDFRQARQVYLMGSSNVSEFGGIAFSNHKDSGLIILKKS